MSPGLAVRALYERSTASRGVSAWADPFSPCKVATRAAAPIFLAVAGNVMSSVSAQVSEATMGVANEGREEG